MIWFLLLIRFCNVVFILFLLFDILLFGTANQIDSLKASPWCSGDKFSSGNPRESCGVRGGKSLLICSWIAFRVYIRMDVNMVSLWFEVLKISLHSQKRSRSQIENQSTNNCIGERSISHRRAHEMIQSDDKLIISWKWKWCVWYGGRWWMVVLLPPTYIIMAVLT